MPTTATRLVTVHTTCRIFVQLDVEDGSRAILTPCCQAAATGTTEGINCKTCYRLVPAVHGRYIRDFGSLVDALAEYGCPCPEVCAPDVVWRAEELLRLHG